MQGLVAEATLERKLRLFQDVRSNGFKVVAGRKNGHIGHVQRDRFLDTEALAEEKKRGADTEEWSISGIGQIFFRANACRRSEVDSSHTAMLVTVAPPCDVHVHTEVHPPATKSVIVAVHEFFFAAIGRLRQMVASGKGAQQEGGEEHHGRWRGTIYFDCWGLGIPKSTWEEYSSSIYAMVLYLPRLYHLKVLILLFFKCFPWFSYPFLFKNLSNFLLFSFLVLSIFTFCKFIQLSKDCSLVVANMFLPIFPYLT